MSTTFWGHDGLDREQVAETENAYQGAAALGASHEEAQEIADLVERGKVVWEDMSEQERLDTVSIVREHLESAS